MRIKIAPTRAIVRYCSTSVEANFARTQLGKHELTCKVEFQLGKASSDKIQHTAQALNNQDWAFSLFPENTSENSPHEDKSRRTTLRGLLSRLKVFLPHIDDMATSIIANMVKSVHSNRGFNAPRILSAASLVRLPTVMSTDDGANDGTSGSTICTRRSADDSERTQHTSPSTPRYVLSTLCA